MAQGDVRTQIADVPADSLMVIQPALGEHWRVEDVSAAGDGVNSGYFEYFDGVISGLEETISTHDINYNSYRMRKAGPGILPLYINNSLYIRLFNHSGGSRRCSLIALQIK